ncbi:hypothetical protein E3N88_34906 [Mikania micrantha]|uniref:Uncharacterized protein n=1 Tax=Mikania micrantha TaxID=192012 RepID=A0A5N6M0C5_9ASTR|nr:hypothetical protein E3N88_34906 [Mikania micrantha]
MVRSSIFKFVFLVENIPPPEAAMVATWLFQHGFSHDMIAKNAYEVALETVVVDLLKAVSSVTKRTPKLEIAYTLIDKQEGETKVRDDYISFVGLLVYEKQEVKVLLKQGSWGCERKKRFKLLPSHFAKRFMRGKLLFLMDWVTWINGWTHAGYVQIDWLLMFRCCIIKDGSGCFVEAIANK